MDENIEVMPLKMGFCALGCCTHVAVSKLEQANKDCERLA